MLRDYYYLTKPGIIKGNLFTAVAGFLFASHLHIDWLLFAATIAGTALIIGSGCVFNNYIDRGIDKKMDRTQKRALVKGTVSPRAALVYGTVLGLIGFALLAVWVNTVTVVVGAVGWFFYVVMYGIYKRRSVHGTLVGSISGSASLAAGYTAVTGRFDTAALLLFLIMAAWQMPHFYAIAMYRYKDYKAAGLPVLPVVQGMRVTKIYILAYVVLFAVCAVLLTTFGYTGIVYMAAVSMLSAWWFWKGYQGLQAKDDVAWAGKMFGSSLVVLMAFSAIISLDTLLP